MELGLGDFIAMIERYFGQRVAKATTAFVGIIGGLILLAVAFQWVVVPIRDSTARLFTDSTDIGSLLSFVAHTSASAALGAVLGFVIYLFVWKWFDRSTSRVIAEMQETLEMIGNQQHQAEQIVDITRRFVTAQEANLRVVIKSVSADIDEEEWLVAGALPAEAETWKQVLDERLEWGERWAQLVKHERSNQINPQSTPDTSGDQP